MGSARGAPGNRRSYLNRQRDMNNCLVILTLAAFLQVVSAQDAENRVDRNARLINLAILTLPDHLVSDLPKTERGDLLKLFCAEGRGRLDYENGFVDYYRDGAAAWDKPSGSCRFWMKLFHGDDGSTFLFVHNYRPRSSKEMTAFFRWDYYDVENVTSEYLPTGVDLSLHFRPRREFNTIRVAEYEEYKLEGKKYEGKTDHRIGSQTSELIWTGKGFELRKTEPTEIPHLDRPQKKQSQDLEAQGEQ